MLTTRFHSWRCLLRQGLAGLLVFTVCVFTARAGEAPEKSAAAATRPPAAEVPEEYRIQPGDLLFISVWREPDLQTDALVRSDGGLSFPLAGDVQAEGLSVKALSDTIAERLRKYVPDAIVNVTVKGIGGNRIYVIGRVNRPGEIPFMRPLDVMQALSLAGGTTPYAAVNDIKILRWQGERQVVIRFRYSDVAKGRALEQNIRLESGDTVVVP